MRHAEARVIQTPRRKINHKYRSQGNRIQRRAVARVIRDITSQETKMSTRVTIRQPRYHRRAELIGERSNVADVTH